MRRNRIIAFILAALLLLTVGCTADGIDDETTTQTEENAVLRDDGMIAAIGKDGSSQFSFVYSSEYGMLPACINLINTLEKSFQTKIVFSDDSALDESSDAKYELLIGDNIYRKEASELRNPLNNREFAIKSFRKEDGTIKIVVAFKSFDAGTAAICYLIDNFITEDGLLIPSDADIREEIQFNRDYTPIPVNAEKLFESTIEKNEEFYNPQGGMFDGEYFYQVFSKVVDGYESACIGVFDKNGNLIRETDEMDIHHGNAVSDLGDGTMMISEFYSADGSNYEWTLLDKESLTVIKEGTVPYYMLSLDYSRDRENYISVNKEHTAMILDKDLKVLSKAYIGFADGTEDQNFYQTENAILSARYSHIPNVGFTNYIYVYDVNLICRHVYTFDVSGENEIQAVSVIDGKVYAHIANHSAKTFAIYQMDIEL